MRTRGEELFVWLRPSVTDAEDRDREEHHPSHRVLNSSIIIPANYIDLDDYDYDEGDQETITVGYYTEAYGIDTSWLWDHQEYILLLPRKEESPLRNANVPNGRI